MGIVLHLQSEAELVCYHHDSYVNGFLPSFALDTSFRQIRHLQGSSCDLQKFNLRIYISVFLAKNLPTDKSDI